MKIEARRWLEKASSGQGGDHDDSDCWSRCSEVKSLRSKPMGFSQLAFSLAFVRISLKVASSVREAMAHRS